jgi:hypothetical protein
VKLKKCSCGTVQTSKTAKKLGRQALGGFQILYFNCGKCNSTFCLVGDPRKKKEGKK